MNTELCASRVDKNTTTKYWPDKTAGKCVWDLANPAEDLRMETFDSIEDCCSKGITWKTADCAAASSGGTGKFFVNWSLGQGQGRCVQDCKGTPPCHKIAESDSRAYDTENACCERLTWVPRQDCLHSE